MTRKRAIEILGQYDVNFCWMNGESIPVAAVMDAIDLGIAALKAQEPMKPAIGETGFKCRFCGEDIALGQKFCHECGKPVKWE